MSSYSKKIEVLKQEEPLYFRNDKSEEDNLNTILWLICDKLLGFRLYPLILSEADKIPSNSIEYALKAYDEGYDAILADGKLLGYRNGMPS